MSALLKAELVKLRTTRTFAAMAGAALGLSLLIAGLIAALETMSDREDAVDLLTIDAASLFILLLGAIGITGEWRHRTITSSLLAAPDRVRFVVAKLLAYATAGLVLSLVVTGAVAALTTVLLSSRDEPTAQLADVVEALWRNGLVAALGGALGVAFGLVIRNQAGALVTLLALGFVVEPVMLTAANDVGRFMPVNAAVSAINRAGDDELLLGPLAGLVVELGWIAGLAALGAALLIRRDL